MTKSYGIEKSICTQIDTFESLLSRFDVQLKCPDYASNERLSGKQKKFDEKISLAVANLSVFFNDLSEENFETLCVLAGRNKNGKHDPLGHWWRSFTLEERDICHNKLAKEGKALVDIMKRNLQNAPR